MICSRTIRLLGLALAAAGCVATPPPDRTTENGVEVPSAWKGAPSMPGEPDMDWVRRFHSPALNQLVAEALSANPDLKAAAARVDQAKATARSVRSQRGPKIDADLSANRRKQNFLGFPFGNEPTQQGGGEPPVVGNIVEGYEAGLNIKWELDLWGRIRAGESAAIAAVQASEADLAGARVSLAAEVCKAWFALAEADEQVRLAEETTRITADTVRSIRERFEAGQATGRGTGTDLRLAMTDESAAKAELANVRRSRDQAVRRIEVLLGRYPSGKLLGDAVLPNPGSPPPSGLPSGLLLRRPDLIAAERRFAAQGARAKEARLAIFPTLSLTGSSGYSTDDLQRLLESDFGVWSLAGGIVQPIFYSGEIKAEQNKRRAEERESQAAFQKSVLQAFGEVETALASEALLAERVFQLEEATRLAGEADREARSDYREGRGDALTVFTAQTRLVQNRRQLAVARLVRLENRINLHLALGGDFTP
ncbi:MAG: efflux transporter outer membrane subunit [Verrucomicrobiales bacterium]